MTKKTFRIKFLESLSALIISAFGLVAALAWNEAIKKTVAEMFSTGDQLLGLFIYALLVTVIAVAATMLITWAKDRAMDDIEEE